MKIYKWTIVFSFFVSAVSIIFAIALNYSSFTFLTDVFLAVFGSALMALILAIISYLNERKKLIIEYCLLCYKFGDNLLPFDKTVMRIQDNGFNMTSLNDHYETLRSMQSLYNYKIFPLAKEISEGCFKACKSKKLYKELTEAEKYIVQIFDDVNDDITVILDYYIEGKYSQEQLKSFNWKTYDNENVEIIKQCYRAIEKVLISVNYFIKTGEQNNAD